MLIDVHAHFYTERSGRADWQEVNGRRLAAGDRMGVTVHVASILGTWGARSPTYFPSSEDVSYANDRMLALQRQHPGKVLGYCVVNPNYTDHALREIDRRIEDGMVGVKLAASRRASDRLLDPIAERAAQRGVPILQHVWQHRRRDWPGQEASDAVELSVLAERRPGTRFLLGHLGGGGDWLHSLRAVADVANIWIDLSGSGVDVGMLEAALERVGAERLVWGADITLDTGWAKLRYLASLGLTPADLERIKHGNARAIFPRGAFDGRG
ncbi:MAG: amidohydrolase [Gemmatimonadetes bacterium]|nr:amidohydrolase [Gemmatimonadota bacterium]